VTAELFAFRVVLKGIVLAHSTRETVFTDHVTYRAIAGQGRLTRLRRRSPLTSIGAESVEFTSGAVYRLSTRGADNFPPRKR